MDSNSGRNAQHTQEEHKLIGSRTTVFRGRGGGTDFRRNPTSLRLFSLTTRDNTSRQMIDPLATTNVPPAKDSI